MELPYAPGDVVAHPDFEWARQGFTVLSVELDGSGAWTLHVTETEGGGWWTFPAEEVTRRSS